MNQKKRIFRLIYSYISKLAVTHDTIIYLGCVFLFTHAMYVYLSFVLMINL